MRVELGIFDDEIEFRNDARTDVLLVELVSMNVDDDCSDEFIGFSRLIVLLEVSLESLIKRLTSRSIVDRSF